MATSSFEKDFIVTDKQAPLWEKALAHFENKKIEWTPAKNRRVPKEDLVEFLKKVKSRLNGLQQKTAGYQPTKY